MMKNFNLSASAICAAVMLLAFGFTAQAKPGDLDQTFGSGGVAKTQFSGGAIVGASALQSDGKIIVVGEFSYSGDQRKPFVARYNSDGSLDQTFGSGGITTMFFIPRAPQGNESSALRAVAIQSDGKIVVAGHAQASISLTEGYDDAALARLNTNGSLDSSFGAGGQVLTQTDTGLFQNNLNGSTTIYSLQIAPDGTFYAVGGGFFHPTTTSNNNNPIVLKYSASGALLGLNRSIVIVPADFVGAANFGSASVLQPDGKLIFTVVGSQITIKNFVLVRLNPDLSFDAGFNGSGIVQTSFPTLAQANGIVIDPNGKITASGGQNGGNNDQGNFYAARYKPDGTLDLSFGNGGKVYLTQPDQPSSFKAGGAIARQSDGKYVIALTLRVGAIRLLPGGSVDPTFGGNGIAIYDGTAPGNPNLSGPGSLILLQPDGKILLPSTVLNPFGSLTGFIEIARLTNEPVSGNPIDIPDTFVRQQYNDFLNRQPDSSGLAFWTNEITSCNGDAQCLDIKRQNVSAAFFLSREFQETGFFVIKLQRAAFGKLSVDSTKRITFQQFLIDARAVGNGFVDLQPGADQVIDQNKTAYAQSVAGSAAFLARYPTTLSAAGYVDALYATAGVTPQGTERQDAINLFGSGDTAGRAASLRKISESNSVKNAEFNTAFVLMQYFGYLRRNPTDAPDTDDSGYQFWLSKLNSFGGNFIRSEMVKAFIVSTEYRGRFGTP